MNVNQKVDLKRTVGQFSIYLVFRSFYCCGVSLISSFWRVKENWQLRFLNWFFFHGMFHDFYIIKFFYGTESIWINIRLEQFLPLFHTSPVCGSPQTILYSSSSYLKLLVCSSGKVTVPRQSLLIIPSKSFRFFFMNCPSSRSFFTPIVTSPFL